MSTDGEDAEKAAEHARQTDELLREQESGETAGAYASLAVYYQLKANESGNADLAWALRRHAGGVGGLPSPGMSRGRS